MSRFSLSEFKGLGWVITHLNPEGEGDKPKQVVAEKALSAPGFPDTLVHEEAHTVGLLLERLHAYEIHLKERGYYEAKAVADAARHAASQRL